MKFKLILILWGSTMSCENKKSDVSNFKVSYKGALKNMIFKGDISAKLNLADLQGTPNLYALGAAENLKGEIQIFDSKPSNTIAGNGKLTIDSSFNKKVTLIVYASVEKWESFQIPESISSYEQLEIFIEQSAMSNQINTDEPFPFLVQGIAKKLDWHVIDWKEGDTNHTHEKHKSSGLSSILNNKQVEILGFYSKSHHAIFTHHSTNMHLHMKTADGKIAGHLDDLTLAKGMILKLPQVK